MKRLLAVLLVVLLVLGGLTAYAAVATGPAPNAGDGISNGSGIDPEPVGPGETPGPAPNAGDGIPDGSGF